jgi:diguanylate cyclase
MLAEIPTSVALLAINLLFAAIALAIGFAVGAWLFGSRQAKHHKDDADDRSAKARQTDHQRATERAMMASQRIKDLAAGMASDVGAHTTQVEAMTANLKALAGDETGTDKDAVFMAISRIVEANSQLQNRLSNAEKQLENQAQELRSYESEARTDSLTGLANRRAFDDELGRRFSEWQRRKTLFTLLILDIDHFKKFNDSHGHLAGDEVLRCVSGALVKTARQMDVPCRYGGEEFAVILPATPIDEAKVAAERFRTAIEESLTKFEGKKLSVTSSVGLAQVLAGDDQVRLIRRADEALYKSKAAGRNCGHWHDGQQCLPVVGAAPDADTPAENAADPIESLALGLANEQAFTDILHRRVVESHRFGLPLSVLFLKVDSHQRLTQEYGKPTAGMALNSVVSFFQTALREMDLLARLGDGEFVAMLPGSTQVEAAQIAKRIRTAMGSCVVPLGEQQIRLAFSHGIAQLKPHETAPLLVARAKSESKKSATSRTV